MELDWTTFILEVINFLVLVWLLRRFLYRPVMNVVAERRAAIARTLQEATSAREEAISLKSQFENRLQEWQKERERARDQLRDEIDTERRKRMTQLEGELAQQRLREQVLVERREESLLREARRRAVALSGQFAAKLLARLADPVIQERLLAMLLEDLGNFNDRQREQLTHSQTDVVRVVSAFPLSEQERGKIATAFQKVLGIEADYEFREDPALQAGVSIHIGAQRLQANLQEELRFFGDSIRDDA